MPSRDPRWRRWPEMPIKVRSKPDRPLSTFYAIFNIANPLIALLFGFTGIGVEPLSASAGKGLPGMIGQPAV